METKQVHIQHDNKIDITQKKSVYQKIKVDREISATIMNYNVFNSITSKIETQKPALGFGFCLSGTTKASIKCFKNEFVIQGGQSVFYYLPHISVRSEHSSKEWVKRISIAMPAEIFQEFVANEYDVLPNNIRKLAKNNEPEPFRKVDKLTPIMRKILMQIFNCPYEGVAKRFFIEAKIMELIACKFDLMMKEQKTDKPVVKLRKDDVDRLYFARDLLINNIEQPMGLFELSSMVGVSRTKLLNGFAFLFGTTPTSYLRDARIEKAKALIDQGDMSLTEIAHTVGYSSSSHFTKVFKQYFSVTPTQYASKFTA